MFHVKHPNDDTIAAIATPIGLGGIGIIRISGPAARQILTSIFSPKSKEADESHRMMSGWIIDEEGRQVDEVNACYMRAPRSYTGEETAELYCHGGKFILGRILERALDEGARAAERGEFTKRAFLNGKIDLTQAEAVADLIKAETGPGAGLAIAQLAGRLNKTVEEGKKRLIMVLAEIEAAIDFPDDFEKIDREKIVNKLKKEAEWIKRLGNAGAAKRIYRDGVNAVIAGKPNVGKSSLFNLLLKEERAIVTAQPGTTRDTIEEKVEIRGIPIRVIDTAGVRKTRNNIEKKGLNRAKNEIKMAGMVIVVLDSSTGIKREDKETIKAAKGKRGIIVVNKVDIRKKEIGDDEIRKIDKNKTIIRMSVRKKAGVSKLEEAIEACVLGDRGEHEELSDIIINNRHLQCLMRARAGIEAAIGATLKGKEEELIALEIKDAIISLGEISGEAVSEKTLDRIFKEFCVGK